MLVGGRDFRVQYNCILVKLVQMLKKGRRKRKAERAPGRTRGRRFLPLLWEEKMRMCMFISQRESPIHTESINTLIWDFLLLELYS